jgi:hypothetical protein
MIIFVLAILLPIFVASAGVDSSVADGTIYGHVYEAKTGEAVSGAFVLCEGGKAATDAEGRYAIEGGFDPSTSYTVTCYASGYPDSSKTVVTESDGKAEADFYLGSEVPTAKTTTWSKTFGEVGLDWGYSIQETRDGGYIITGGTWDEANSGGILLLKIDRLGNTTWSTVLGSVEGGLSVLEGIDLGYIVLGLQMDDTWLINTDSKGQIRWLKTFEGLRGHSIQETEDDGYIVVGCTRSGDAWLMKTDLTGNKIWDNTFGGSDYDLGNSVQQTRDGGFIVVGSTESYGAGRYDIWLIKTDSKGYKEWDKTFGGSKYDQGHSVKQTEDGGFIVVGSTESYGSGDWDVWLIKTDPLGNKEWDKTFGGLDSDEGHSIQVSKDGSFIIVGSTNSFGARGRGFPFSSYVGTFFGGDVWLIKTDPTGNIIWDKIFGGAGDDVGFSVLETDDGYIVTGFTEPYDEGYPDTINHDIWIIKTDLEGNCEQARRPER